MREQGVLGPIWDQVLPYGEGSDLMPRRTVNHSALPCQHSVYQPRVHDKPRNHHPHDHDGKREATAAAT